MTVIGVIKTTQQSINRPAAAVAVAASGASVAAEPSTSDVKLRAEEEEEERDLTRARRAFPHVSKSDRYNKAFVFQID